MIGKRRIVGLVLAVTLVAAGASLAEDSSSQLDALKQELAELRRLVDSMKEQEAGQDRLAELERRIDILAAEIEKLSIGRAAVTAGEGTHGLGPAASKVYRSDRGVSIGGYGELLYQNFDSEQENGTPANLNDQIDMLRAVLYFGYKFDDRFLFNSEIEFEHASTEDDGEVSVEFAYLDWLKGKQLNLRAGLVLLPVGLINELHEPTVFLSTTRPQTERRILPSTWRENGVGMFGSLGPFDYRAYVVNGLDASGFDATGLRDGRQDGSEAKAEDMAGVARFDYVGTEGLIAGASFYGGDSAQDLAGTGGQGLDVKTQIFEAHVDWRWRALRLRALAAQADVDDVAELNDSLGLVGAASVGEELHGGYVEAGFDVLAHREQDASLIPFARWEQLDTQASVPAGFTRDPANDDEIITWGVAYQPLPQLILKVDYQDVSDEAGTGVNQFNAALGYVF